LLGFQNLKLLALDIGYRDEGLYGRFWEMTPDSEEQVPNQPSILHQLIDVLIKESEHSLELCLGILRKLTKCKKS
jgi:hypothetical protein